MNKKQKLLRLNHFKTVKKLNDLFNNPHFIKKNIQDTIENENKKFLIEFNKQ